MTVEIYWAAVGLTGAASAISHLANINPVLYSPVQNKPFQVITSLSALIFFVLLVTGFFVYNWQAVAIGVVATMIATPILKVLATATPFYSAITMVIAIGGIGAALLSFIA